MKREATAGTSRARPAAPRRRFGQHFLEAAWVRKLVDAIQPMPEDRFLEIGPGRGAITALLAQRVAHVVAVEVDRDLAADLVARRIPNLTIVVADVLEVDLTELALRELNARSGRKVRVAGNLPYNISSPILFRLLAAAQSGLFEDATLMLQREVANRLVARPGSGDYGVLSVLTAMAADAVPVLALPPGAFRPMPRVHSAVVRLLFRPPPVPVMSHEVFVQLVRSIFTQRRKTLANALARFASERGADARTALARAGIDPHRRPETLQLVELGRLADLFAP